MSTARARIVDELLAGYGTTFAREAGIRLRGGSASLFQLLCLSLLLSARIRSEVAVAAMRALHAAGWRDQKALAASTWSQRTTVLNRSGYARYDESTARMLGSTAELVGERYHGDLSRLRRAADGDRAELRTRLKECKGIGDVGADIFLREVQQTWPEVGPFFGARSLDTASELGLPSSAEELAALCHTDDLARLAAALVRVGHRGKAARRDLRDRAA